MAKWALELGLAAALLIPMLVGCSSSPQEPTKTTAAPRFVAVYIDPSLNAVLIRYTVDGAPVKPQKTNTGDLVLETRLGESSRVSAQALTPCGWREIPVQMQAVPPELAGQDILRLAWLTGGLETVGLVVDNRKGEAAEIAAGQWRYKIVPDTIGTVQMPRPDCPEGSGVSLNGRELFRITGSRDSHLIDTSGSRCYRFRGVNYFPSGRPGFPAWNYTLIRDRSHRIEESGGTVDFLLQKAPSALRSSLPVEQKSELTEIACP